MIFTPLAVSRWRNSSVCEIHKEKDLHIWRLLLLQKPVGLLVIFVLKAALPA